jgi:hypothetical protein
MRKAVLGTGLALPPLAWFASLEANFALAPLACAGRGKSPLLTVSLVAFVLAVTGGVLAWTQRDFYWRIVAAGLGISCLFSIVILAQAIPNLMLGGCE